MINSQFTIDYTVAGIETVEGESISSDDDRVETPSKWTSDRKSNCINGEPIAKKRLSSIDSKKKPPHSYIAMISMAILSKPDKKMLLNDIYQYIMEHFPFYNNEEKAWKNNIRHNLSLNECFGKHSRSNSGKGNYWSIHPSCMEEFAIGDFRRRQARRRARTNSVKSVNGSYYENDFRYNFGYVPMTSSLIGFNSMNGTQMHTPLHSPFNIFQSPVSELGTTAKPCPATIQSFGTNSLFNVTPSTPFVRSFNAQSVLNMKSSFSSNTNPVFYPSCQIQRGFSDW
ncbi:Forkhead box protein I1,Forkhead box protein L1 [Mytilus edulis]|uniref:Forkhead box protein I1,Forkhead box protein L1 n=1 Tax=Mytilus edulis TaxID=6550 RepID=A0A8S3S1N6_MYTED|nr:Forkhead box protein I1,Forkhead box protein L1 [Mytilus edulis]